MAAKSSKKTRKSRPSVSPEVITIVSIILTLVIGYFMYSKVMTTVFTGSTYANEDMGL